MYKDVKVAHQDLEYDATYNLFMHYNSSSFPIIFSIMYVITNTQLLF